jgi:hypothetical protein
MPIDEENARLTWSRFDERVGVTLWTSFLAACLETLVFFAFFDPMVFGSVDAAPTWLTLRPAAYAAGFFFFWIFAFVGSSLTAYLLDSSPNAPPKTAERIK